MFAINRALKGLHREFIKAEEQEQARASLSFFLLSFRSFVLSLNYHRSAFDLYATRSAIYFRGFQSVLEEARSEVVWEHKLVLVVATVRTFKMKIIDLFIEINAQHAFTSETFRLPQANTYISASSTTDNSILEKLIKAIISLVGSGGQRLGSDLWLGGRELFFKQFDRPETGGQKTRRDHLVFLDSSRG